MSEQWTAAELIPTAGIKGALEQERRATSALLAVMGAVREYGRSVTKAIGAPAGKIETFIEVPFELDGKRCAPDGLIRISRGNRVWTVLVETKTASNRLEPAQVETYLEVARLQGFDGVLTISNEIPPIFGTHPTQIDRRKLRGNLSLHHLSWTWLLTEAVVQKQHRGVADPDQAWLLGELIRYLEHPRSGAVDFDDMGDSWTVVRDAVRAGTLRANDRGAGEVAAKWDQLIRYASLRLGRYLGTDVEPDLSRKERDDLTLRAQRLRETLQRDGYLEGGLRIPDTVGPLTVRADLRARQLIASVRVDAPRTGRARTRVNWLVRQLADAPGSLRIDAEASHSRGNTTSALLQVARDRPDVLIEDQQKELRRFTVAMVAPMGTKRGTGRGSFVESVLSLIDVFYESVVQNLHEWSASPPRLKQRQDADEDEPVAASEELPEFPDETPSTVELAAAAPETEEPEPEEDEPAAPSPAQPVMDEPPARVPSPVAADDAFGRTYVAGSYGEADDGRGA